MNYRVIILLVTTLGLCSCDIMQALLNSGPDYPATSSYGYGSYSTPSNTTTTTASSSSKEWHKCSACNGTGLCKSCGGSGKSRAKDGKCHVCQITGNGKCVGCKGKGGWYA